LILFPSCHHLLTFFPRGSAGKPVAHRKGKGNEITILFFLSLFIFQVGEETSYYRYVNRVSVFSGPASHMITLSTPTEMQFTSDKTLMKHNRLLNSG
jgi:hypothetical protein